MTEYAYRLQMAQYYFFFLNWAILKTFIGPLFQLKELTLWAIWHRHNNLSVTVILDYFAYPLVQDVNKTFVELGHF